VHIGQAVSICFAKYADFRGRASRPEYWWFTLFVTIVSLIALTFDALARSGLYSTIWNLAVLLPTLAVTVRRLRDAGLHWAWILIGLVPLVGWVILIVLLARPSTEQQGVAAPA
jgi:uncharacterized membrane protein YhaH (DUF805 family)